MTTTKYPNVKVQLTGRDGNAFAIIGACMRAARMAGLSKAEISAFVEDATAGNYDHVLQAAMRWFDVS